MKKGFFAAGIVLSAATWACSIFIGGPAYPVAPLPVSTEAAQSLQDEIQAALAAGAQTGTVTFNINESQITSYLNQQLDSQTDPIISDPQVLLRDGQMKIYGKAQSGILIANVSITTQVSLDENGKPRILVTQSDFGPLPSPQGLNDAATALLSELFTGSIGPAALGFRLESVSIADGSMTVMGRIK